LEAERETGTTLADLLADPAPGPAERAETDEMSDAVWTAIGKLAPAQRAAIVLRYFVGLSETEMTQELVCPRGTIASPGSARFPTFHSHSISSSHANSLDLHPSRSSLHPPYILLTSRLHPV
jgi:Sigma-70, region 4